MSQPIVIQELSGSERVIVLGGRALPERPLPAGGRTRHKLTWYAGNAVGTLQVLGVEDKSTTINGEWNDRFIADQVTVQGFETPTLAREVVAIFENIQRSGNAIRFQWGDVVRMGILADFDPEWQREQDVRWSMEFAWYGRDDLELPRASADEPPNSSELRNRQNESDNELAFEPSGTRPDYSSRVRTRISRVRGKVGAIFDRVRAAQSGDAIPLTAVRGALGDASGLRDAANLVSVDLLEAPLEVATASDRLLDRLRVQVWRSEQGRRVRRVLAEGQRVALELRRSTRPEPLAVVTARAGDSLRRLALRYYGSADEWQRIASANDLTDSVLTPGALIVIPPGAAQAERPDG